jgi:hypothetical protein
MLVIQVIQVIQPIVYVCWHLASPHLPTGCQTGTPSSHPYCHNLCKRSAKQIEKKNLTSAPALAELLAAKRPRVHHSPIASSCPSSGNPPQKNQATQIDRSREICENKTSPADPSLQSGLPLRITKILQYGPVRGVKREAAMAPRRGPIYPGHCKAAPNFGPGPIRR